MLCSYVAGRLTFTAEVRYFVAIKALYIMPAGTKDLVDIVLVSECQMVTAWKSAPPTPHPPSEIDMMTHTHTLEPKIPLSPCLGVIRLVGWPTHRKLSLLYFLFGVWQAVRRCQ